MILINGSYGTVNQVIALAPGNRYIEVPNTAPSGHPSTAAVQIQDQLGNVLGSIADPNGVVWAAIVAAA